MRSPGTSGTSGCIAAPVATLPMPSSTRTPPTARACGSLTRAMCRVSCKLVSSYLQGKGRGGGGGVRDENERGVNVDGGRRWWIG